MIQQLTCSQALPTRRRVPLMPRVAMIARTHACFPLREIRWGVRGRTPPTPRFPAALCALTAGKSGSEAADTDDASTPIQRGKPKKSARQMIASVRPFPLAQAQARRIESPSVLGLRKSTRCTAKVHPFGRKPSTNQKLRRSTGEKKPVRLRIVAVSAPTSTNGE